jgi:hypothetical protein
MGTDNKTLHVLPKVGDKKADEPIADSAQERREPSSTAVEGAALLQVPVIKTVKVYDHEGDFDQQVNELAKDGWDLRSIHYIPDGGHLWFLANFMKFI